VTKRDVLSKQFDCAILRYNLMLRKQLVVFSK